MKPTLADSLCLSRLCEELRDAIEGAVVKRVTATGSEALILETAGRRAGASVLVSWAAGAARAHLLSESARGSDRPLPVAGIHKLLGGAIIRSVRQIDFDRVLAFELANVGGLGPDQVGSLVLEATDREPNCVMLQDGRVVWVARPRPLRAGVYRSLVPGEPYVPPPGSEKLDPRTATPESLAQVARDDERPLALALRAVVQGLSRVFLDESLARAGLDGSIPVAQQPSNWPHLWLAAVAEILADASQGNAWLWRDEAGKPALVYPVCLRHLGREPEPIDSLSAGLAAIGQRIEEERRVEHLRAAVRRTLKRQLERKRRLLARRQEELSSTAQAETWRRWGELIVANLGALDPHAAAQEIEVTDYYSPDQPRVRVPLVSGLGPRASAEEYFARYRKARRAAARLPALVEAARKDVDRLEAELRRLDEVTDLAELAAMAEQLGATQESQRKREEVRLAVGRAVAPSGHVVLFGRTAAENDEILRLARPSDIWLHARGVHGAHVLIRTNGAPENVPYETLLWAARLAGKMSDYRRDGVADVDYTLARYVRKPRGSPPGFVTYTHQKTLHLSLE